MERFKNSNGVFQINILSENDTILDTHLVKIDDEDDEGTELNAEVFNSMLDEINDTLNINEKGSKLGFIFTSDSIKIIIENR